MAFAGGEIPLTRGRSSRQPVGGTRGLKDISVSCFQQPGRPHGPAAAFIASEFISWPTAPLKTDISFYVVDQTILLNLKKKQHKNNTQKPEGWGLGDEYLFDLGYFVFLNNWQLGRLALLTVQANKVLRRNVPTPQVLELFLL